MFLSGIHVISTGDLSVQGANINDFTSDAFLVLPTDSLGTEYMAMSYLYMKPSHNLQVFRSCHHGAIIQFIFFPTLAFSHFEFRIFPECQYEFPTPLQLPSITQKSNELVNLKLYHMVHKNISDEIDVGHCLIKVTA